MKKEIHIRYLQQGLIKVSAPREWDEMDEMDKEIFCENYISGKKDCELVSGMSDFTHFDINDFFAMPPIIEAIEIIGEDSSVITEASTPTWSKFASSTGGLTWNRSL